MLPYGWRSLLRNHARVTAIVTLNRMGLDPSSETVHLATQPGSYTFAADTDIFIPDRRTGRVIPFHPWLASWPEVKRRFSPTDRRAEISTSSIEVTADSGLTDAVLASGSGQGITGRVDLVIDGQADIMDVFPLLAGTVRQGSAIPTRNGGVSFSLSDGDPEFVKQFPPELMTRGDFPLAPSYVANVEKRTTIIGPFPERVLAKPITADRRTFYVCDPPCSTLPSVVFKGGERIYSGFRIYNTISPLGLAYTEIALDKPVDQYAEGVNEELSVSGGVGVIGKNAVEFLLDYGGIKTTAEARANMRYFDTDFPLSVLINQGDVLSLVRNIVAQTPMAFTLFGGRASIMRIDAATPQRSVGIGNGLLARLAEQAAETDLASVYNAIEVTCSRDQFASTSTSTTPLYTAYRDRSHGPPEIRELCSRSEAEFGRRFLSFAAADVAVQTDLLGHVTGSVGGEILVDHLVRQHALPRRSHGYLTDWLTGLALDLNWRALLTDEAESLDELACRVTEITYGPTGPEVVFQEVP